MSREPLARPGRGRASPPRAVLPRVLVTGSVAMALSAPGQTAAISVFVDPIVADLGISRSAVSSAYLIGSLSGAFVMPVLGRAIDRFGTRRLMVAVAAAFSVVLLLSSAASGIVGLTGAFVGVRVAGQGALSLIATTTVAIHVHRRRGFAIGLVSAVGSAGISLAPVALEALIGAHGWREVWFGEGVVVLALIPVALWVLPRRPPTPPDPVADPGSTRPGGAPSRPGPPRSWTRAEAMRTGMFWVVAAGVGTSSMIATGLNFQQESLLGERGLSAAAAAATFLPQTVAGLVATFGLGWLADHCSDRLLVVSTMVVLAAATLGGGWLEPGWSAIAYGAALGACANGVRALEAVAFPRLFGLAHLGSIRGVVHAIAVGASAFGPLALALGRSLADSYRPTLVVLALLPTVVVLAAVLVRDPGAGLRPAPYR